MNNYKLMWWWIVVIDIDSGGGLDNKPSWPLIVEQVSFTPSSCSTNDPHVNTL